MLDAHIPMKSINTYQDESIPLPSHLPAQYQFHITCLDTDKGGNSLSMRNYHYSLLYFPWVVRTIAEQMDAWDGSKTFEDELVIANDWLSILYNRKMGTMV